MEVGGIQRLSQRRGWAQSAANEAEVSSLIGGWGQMNADGEEGGACQKVPGVLWCEGGGEAGRWGNKELILLAASRAHSM